MSVLQNATRLTTNRRKGSAMSGELNLFSLIGDVSFDKKGIFHESDEAEKQYNKYMVELMLSQHPDCILYVNELNRRPFLSKKMHHDYLFHSLPKRKRFAKLSKPVADADVEIIKEVFGYSTEKAQQVLPLFSPEQMEKMRQSRFTGGVLQKKKATK
jgi:hypothetical protein